MSELARVLIDVPGRESARRLLSDELSNRAYEDEKPPALLDLLGRFVRWLGSLVSDAAGGIDQAPLAIVVLVALLVLLVVVVLVKVGPRRGGRSGPGALFTGEPLRSAAEHRARAEAAAAAGAFDEAVRERLRAASRELEERGVLERRPGRTAGEVAREAGRAAPPLAAPMATAARTFDEVWYGGRAGDAHGYRVVVAADDAVREARLAAAPIDPAAPAVPS